MKPAGKACCQAEGYRRKQTQQQPFHVSAPHACRAMRGRGSITGTLVRRPAGIEHGGPCCWMGSLLGSTSTPVCVPRSAHLVLDRANAVVRRVSRQEAKRRKSNCWFEATVPPVASVFAWQNRVVLRVSMKETIWVRLCLDRGLNPSRPLHVHFFVLFSAWVCPAPAWRILIVPTVSRRQALVTPHHGRC